jgi:molecular chaperone DnaK
MVRDAESHASEDKSKRERIDRKNQADSLSYQAEKQLAELGDKVPESDRTKVEGLIKDLREAVSQENDDRIKTLTTDLQQALYGISTHLYQQAGGTTAEGPMGGDTPPSSEPPSGGDDVIDAEFSETK